MKHSNDLIIYRLGHAMQIAIVLRTQFVRRLQNGKFIFKSNVVAFFLLSVIEIRFLRKSVDFLAFAFHNRKISGNRRNWGDRIQEIQWHLLRACVSHRNGELICANWHLLMAFTIIYWENRTVWRPIEQKPMNQTCFMDGS